MNLSPVKMHVGNIVVSLEGSGGIYEGIVRRISACRKAQTGLAADIIYRFSPGKFEEDAKDFNCRFKTNFFDIAVIRTNPVIIAFCPVLPFKDRVINFLPEYPQRILYGIGIKRPYSIEELLVEAFFYEVFEWSLHYLLIKKGASYAHASAVRDVIRGEAHVFAGARRSGKSTIAAYLSLDSDYLRPLADDRLIIDNKGKAYFSDSFASLRLSTLLSSDEFKKAFWGSHSRSERILWKLLQVVNHKDTAKRISILRKSDNAQCAAETTIKCCFYLRRAKTAKLTVSKMKADDFASRTSHYIISQRESQFKCIGKIGHDESRIWTKEEIETIHRAAFSGAECFELCIPENMAPSNLGETVKDQIIALSI